jgi:hypothetical protein
VESEETAQAWEEIEDALGTIQTAAVAWTVAWGIGLVLAVVAGIPSSETPGIAYSSTSRLLSFQYCARIAALAFPPILFVLGRAKFCVVPEGRYARGLAKAAFVGTCLQLISTGVLVYLLLSTPSDPSLGRLQLVGLAVVMLGGTWLVTEILFTLALSDVGRALCYARRHEWPVPSDKVARAVVLFWVTIAITYVPSMVGWVLVTIDLMKPQPSVHSEGLLTTIQFAFDLFMMLAGIVYIGVLRVCQRAIEDRAKGGTMNTVANTELRNTPSQ